MNSINDNSLQCNCIEKYCYCSIRSDKISHGIDWVWTLCAQFQLISVLFRLSTRNSNIFRYKIVLWFRSFVRPFLSSNNWSLWTAANRDATKIFNRLILIIFLSEKKGEKGKKKTFSWATHNTYQRGMFSLQAQVFVQFGTRQSLKANWVCVCVSLRICSWDRYLLLCV